MSDLKIKAGDTEPIMFNVDLSGVDNLDNVSSAALYARKKSTSKNHVDGATATVSDSANKELSFDPESNAADNSNAFDTGDEGHYRVYVKLTWSDGDITRHPGGGFRHWHVQENLE